jgi:tripartite-type tricarboxylate transporter receptor subunit TctC
MLKKLTLAVAATLIAGTAAAAEFPADKPVTIVVPFAAGGPTDKVARDLGVALGAALKQTVIIENVGGAGGTLGATRVAKAAPDGYTLLLYHIGMATSASLYRNLPYKTLDDFEYLGMVN